MHSRDFQDLETAADDFANQKVPHTVNVFPRILERNFPYLAGSSPTTPWETKRATANLKLKYKQG